MKETAKLFLFQTALAPLVASVLFLDVTKPLSVVNSPAFYAVSGIYAVLSAIAWGVCVFRSRKGLSPFPELKNFAAYSAAVLTFFLLSVLAADFFAARMPGKDNFALRLDGRLAFLFFAVSLSVSPLVALLKARSSERFLFVRRIAGVVCFLFFAKHGLDYFLLEKLYSPVFYSPEQLSFLARWQEFASYFGKNLLHRPDALSGIVAGALLFVLGATSNRISYRWLGKTWKSLHALAYPAFFLGILHIALSGRLDGFYAVLFALVAILRFAAFSRKSPVRASEDSTRWLCVVCGYVYDEKEGDADSGIAPGTKFRDIPEDWRCPVCGVTKKDFVPMSGDAEAPSERFEARVVENRPLTEDVFELTLSIPNMPETLPGQFATLAFKDRDGEFLRQYSFARQSGERATFLVRAVPEGRGGRIVRSLSTGDSVSVAAFSGEFVLSPSSSPKVFVATGTGLSPIFRMLEACPAEVSKTLFFTVRNESDVFYVEELRRIPGLDLRVHVSRPVGKLGKGLFSGRPDFAAEPFPKDAEFYLCGNPEMVSETVRILRNRGFEKTYSETFA